MSEFPIETVVAEFAWLLLGAALIGILARRLRIPYAVALVVAGLIVEESHLLQVPRLDPGFVLFAFLPPLLGLLFGSIVAATDPVAVIAVVKNLNVPHRLAIVPEAESLVNDGMAITLYTAVVGFAVTGSADPLEIVELLGQEVLGGVAIGAGLGLAFSRLTGAIDDHLIEMMLSTVLAYGSYLIAHSVHASGPLACVVAGLIPRRYPRGGGGVGGGNP